MYPVVKTCISEHLEVRGYILHYKDFAIVIDPGFNVECFLDQLKGKDLKAILLTHGHFDHIAGVEKLKRQYPNTKIYIDQADQSMLYNPSENLSERVNMNIHLAKDIEILNCEEGHLQIDDIHCQVIKIEGHTKGSVGFLFNHILFSGDTLMKETVGVSNVPGQDLEFLTTQIASKLLTLSAAVIVYSGHTEQTTIEAERKNNLYFKDFNFNTI